MTPINNNQMSEQELLELIEDMEDYAKSLNSREDRSKVLTFLKNYSLIVRGRTNTKKEAGGKWPDAVDISARGLDDFPY